MKKNNFSSNRSFGIVFFIFFLILSIFFYIKKSSFIIIFSFIFLSLFFLVSGLLQLKILTPLNSLWVKLGILLGNIISPIILFIIYFSVVLSTKVFLVILRKDVLNLYKKKDTYWIKKTEIKSSMDNQF